MKLLALFTLAVAAFAQPTTMRSLQPDRPDEGRRDFRYGLWLSPGHEGRAPRLQMPSRRAEEGATRRIQTAFTTEFSDPKAPTPTMAAKSFFRSRLFLALLGGAIAGTGAALLATGESSREIPASNCSSFYPAPFVPCIPAHTEKTRSGVRDGFGGGMLVGGLLVVWVSLQH